MLALVLALLLAPAGAAAQAPPDERAAARAFADAALRFSAAQGEAPEAEAIDVAIERPACRREVRRIPEPRSRGAVDIAIAYAFRAVAEQQEPSFFRFRSELANVPTADPALISGRAAWRRAGRTLAALPPPGDLCAELRAWGRAGHPRAAVREARRQRGVFLGAYGRRMQRKTAAAADRMRELGASRRGADAFEGDG